MVADRNLDSLEPGPGTFAVADADGARIRPWYESSTRGHGDDVTFVEPDERDRADFDATVAHMKATAPPVTKTSGIAKRDKMVAMLNGHIAQWQAMLGRPMVVGDLSPQMRLAFHLDSLALKREITPKLIETCARRYLREAENQMRAEQRKRVTKEPFYVDPGVR